MNNLVKTGACWPRAAHRVVALLVTAGLAALPGKAQGQQEGSAQDPVAESRALFIEAVAKAQESDFEAARDLVRRGLALAPRDPDGLNLSGEINERLGDLGAAATAFDLARIADPNWVAPLAGLGRVYLAQGDNLSAATHLRRAVAMQPDDPALLALASTAEAGLGRMREALAGFERAWELQPDSVRFGLDVVRARFGDRDPEGAIEAAERVTELDPQAVMVWISLSELFLDSPSEDEVVRAPAVLRRALELQPDDALLWLRLARTYKDLGLTAEREEALRTAIDKGANGTEILMALGDTLDVQSRHADALAVYTEVIERDPNEGMAYFRRGQAYFNLSDRDQAEADVEQALAVLPGSEEALLTLARFRLHAGDPDGAEAYANQAYEAHPQSLSADLMLGRIRLQQGRENEAIPLLERVASEDPEQIDAQYLLGQALLKRGDTDRGRQLMASYQEKLREQRDYHVESLRFGVMGRGRVFKLRGRVFLQEGRHPEALEQFLAAVDLMPEDREAWTLLANAYDAAGQPTDAQNARERAALLEGAG